MKNMALLGVFASLASISAQASQVGVVDSGTYFEHRWFQGQSWTNTNEIAGNLVDDDNNGLVDDVVGWNFAENLSKVFFPEHISAVRPLVYQIFGVLGRIDNGTATQADRDFWRDNVTSLGEAEKKKLIDELNFYGQYAHGTHCSGIVAKGNPQSKIASMRIFPDSLPPQSAYQTEGLVYETLAAATNKSFFEVAKYLNGAQMDVANFSVGVPMARIARQAMALTGNKNPSDEKVRQEAQKAFGAFERRGKQWIASAPNTLFVIAAANDGASNDVLPIFPANVQAENAITVAATNGWQSLASFSNYSPTLVHVAAPGVAVVSSVPGPVLEQTLPMSGTSMAAPYVTMVSSTLKDANPALTPAEMRQILIATVDKKAWLADKVLSSGVVNPNRALAAAKLSTSLALSAAIAEARATVVDMPEVGSPYGRDAGMYEQAVEPTAEMLAWAAALHR
jgi:subtilisin family serine protease